MLPVSAPFHCANDAARGRPHGRGAGRGDLQDPDVPVVVNVLARPVDDPDDLRQRLVEQVTGTVRWRETIEFMAGKGISRIYEIGAGKVLSGLGAADFART